MLDTQSNDLVRSRYLNVHGAVAHCAYPDVLHIARGGVPRAVVGYRRAGEDELFLERYLDAPVEHCVSIALCRPVQRASVIEIGCLAADDAFAMVDLWAKAANDLGTACEVAVATLTAPLRRMFTRMGVSLHVLAPAMRERSGDPEVWGRYYESDPLVCAGLIAEGQHVITAYFASRRRFAA
ncbi:Thermostable hemolysin [Novosphingobium sp. CF614]|uniref:thermostable hemolysin n=1 Tax=Novosphingobium sp. CF614 TaxID=1884364 RepID=UPI0008E6B50C|nr:thermostable hemolysin [Novosphingobium sp. CF614]SFG16725.1 Thermostable hemolysin [Novosphingobium sp. CF614]